MVARLRERRPDLDLSTVIVTGYKALRGAVEGFIDAGVSKFVLVPMAEPASWDEELSALADATLPLET